MPKRPRYGAMCIPNSYDDTNLDWWCVYDFQRKRTAAGLGRIMCA